MWNKVSKLIFICATLACVGLRVSLKLSVINPATGFYEGGEILSTALNLVLVVGVIALLAIGYLKPSAKTRIVVLPLRVLALLTGLAALAVSGLEILALLDNMRGMGLSAAMVALFFQLCGVASGFVFLAIGLSLRADGRCRVHAALLLLPLVWQIYRLLSSFMAYTAIRSVSDQLLEVMAMVLLAPFLLAHGRVLGGVSSAKGRRQLTAFGLPFALLALTFSTGVIAAAITSRHVAIATSLPQAIFCLVMGLYAAAAVFTLPGDKEAGEAGEAGK